jgi:thymidine phosphorylase
MNVDDVITKKRQGNELSESEIDLLVEGYTAGRFPTIRWRRFAWPFSIVA